MMILKPAYKVSEVVLQQSYSGKDFRIAGTESSLSVHLMPFFFSRAEAAEAAAVSAQGAAESAQTAAENARNAAATSEANAATSEANAATSASGVQAAVADSQSARDQSQAARDTANAHKLAAEAAATSATNTASALTGFDLEAIAETKADTAVDVFVYDTSRDSDGGAWRKRCQHTSWYNEELNTATRGARREFPAVAVIVAEDGGPNGPYVKIYDGDDPSLPLWRDCSKGIPNYGSTTMSKIAAKNGRVLVGENGGYRGFLSLNFPSDEWQWTGMGQGGNGNGVFTGIIANPNFLGVGNPGISTTSKQGTIYEDGTSLVSRTVNDVAMTVLPDAPIDPATGLPVPTIAVATDSGVSVIKDDGTVVDSLASNPAQTVLWNNSQLFWAADNGTSLFFSTLTDIDAGDGFGDRVGATALGAEEIAIPTRALLLENGAFAGGFSSSQAVPGVTRFRPNTSGFTTSMSALITSTYNTGWIPGDIKGAFLADTNDTDLVGVEYVVDGGFDDPTKWTAFGSSTVSGGVLNVSDDVLTEDIYNSGGTPFPADQAAVVTFEILNSSANFGVTVWLANPVSGTKLAVLEGSAYFTTDGTYELSVPENSTGTDWVICFRRAGGHVGTLQIDNVSVKPIVPDRSVNNKGLIVNGTVTREPVAPGAELVAYSGFSSSNYLEQPYNPDLDFGTGDFCVMGWTKSANTTYGNVPKIRHVYDDGSGANGWETISTSGNFRIRKYTNGSLVDYGMPASWAANRWRHWCFIRVGDTVSLYLDGIFSGSNTNPALNTGSMDLTENTGRTLLIWGSSDFGDKSNALLRISGTAPTPEQIRKIYEDEKVLFQENAQATLYGTSDAVTALAHDSATDLLHVGTSAGRSVFQGLRRVGNTTDAVTTAISAHNGLVIEQ